MDEEMVDEIIELGIVLSSWSVSMSWEWYFEFASGAELVTSESKLSSDLVWFWCSPTDIGIELAREIGLDLCTDVVWFDSELWSMDDDLVCHRGK
jgi:hypothetical protein